MPAESTELAAASRHAVSENPFYLHAVAAFAREQPMVAQQDIYGSNGVKLVSKGSQVSQQQFARLAQHRLTVPLDKALASEHTLDAASLAMAASKILDNDNVYCRLTNRSGDPLAIKQALAALKLPPPLWQRLTVMLAQRPAMFEHSLRTAMIAYALAQRLQLPAGERDVLLAAALCHDVGEMHTDPLLLASEHDITPEERRYIHVHPLTSYVLLHGIPGFPPAACQAVLHHHERLDGSGYPHGVRSDKIPPLAKLVAVADVAETVIRRFDLPRLDMLARLHHGRFDQAAVDVLRDLIRFAPQDGLAAPPPQGAAAQLNRLADVLQAWFTLREVFERQVAPAAPEASPLAFLFERMQAIRLLVLQTGIDPDHIDDILALSHEDPAILLELHAMLEEMEWLQLDLANEIDRRAPQLAGLATDALSGLVLHLRPASTLGIPPELLGIAPDEDAEAEAAPPRR